MLNKWRGTKMKKVLAFDVYGTLIDTHGVLALLETMMSSDALVFSNTWRAKQLEYSFRRGLMELYQDFSLCTRDALNFTCEHLQIFLSEKQKRQLLDSYTSLPSFNDVDTGLASLAKDYELVAFSNGEKSSVEALLKNANILDYFTHLITADEIKTFKPSPRIYQHLLTRTNAVADNTWLISSNPFDVIGAKSQQLHGAWVKRSDSQAFDPWGIAPDLIIKQLDELKNKLESPS
jgi:2-haloacid dehalogenase